MSRVTFPREAAGANPLDDIHTDEAEEHQGDWQLGEMIQCLSGVRLHLRAR